LDGAGGAWAGHPGLRRSHKGVLSLS